MDRSIKDLAVHLLSQTKSALDAHNGYKTGTFVVCVINLKTFEPTLQIVPTLDYFLPTLSLSSEEIVVWHRILDFGNNNDLAITVHTDLLKKMDQLGVFLSDTEQPANTIGSKEQEALNLLRYRLDPAFETLPVARQMLWRSLANNLLRGDTASPAHEISDQMDRHPFKS